MVRYILLFSFLFLLVPRFNFAQCDSTHVEVRIDVVTDTYGNETYWTLTDLIGTVILQGGQGGVYANNSSYSDSLCVPADGCFFFEIYDTYGDGIFAPAGYRLYIDDMLVASGSDDIKSYAFVTAHCPEACLMVQKALEDLQGHINGAATLSPDALTLIKGTFIKFPDCLAENEATIELAKSVIEDYDHQIGPLFTTPNTQNGFAKNPLAAPGLEVERAMLALQQGIFDVVFTPEVFADYPQFIKDWKFNSCHIFPGYVDPPADSSLSHSVLIRANFSDPDGMNPYFDINGDGTTHALRPTGLYLSPGSIATVRVPESLESQDYFIRVGSHEWDLTDRNYFRRFDRISRKFPIDSTTIEVFNPFGGAISVLVPYGASSGIVEISVRNAVEAPFFSLKSFYKTLDFNTELDKPGPWAVFETDNVMFTIPSHSIVAGQYDLHQTMLDWDSALQGVNSIMARQIIPDKHNMYMIADIDIRFGAYSIGYPMSNTPLNFTDVPGPAYFINGPGPDDEVNFHESGHALAMSKFPGEEEALVNFPYIMAMNYGLGTELNEAVNYSFVPNTFDIDLTVTHRMVSNTFGTARDISNTTTDEVRYQHRGYGHYFEIVNLLGWCPLRNFWKQEFIDFEHGINHGINDQNIDDRILRMSIAAQTDLRPLFHVFGILPQNAIALQDTFDLIGIKPSVTIYNRLQDYFDLIPQDNTAFINYALSVYPDLFSEGPGADPDYGVGWHYLKSLTYNEAEAQQRSDILLSIVDLYYPNGVPTGHGNPDVCCLLDTLNINIVNEEIIVTGGVEPYDISVDTTGSIQTITVLDFDGCQSTAQSAITDLSEEYEDELRIYPNPASTEIYIDWTGSSDPIQDLQLISIHGQIIHHFLRDDRILDLAALSEGVYILRIQLSGGVQLSKQVLILR